MRYGLKATDLASLERAIALLPDGYREDPNPLVETTFAIRIPPPSDKKGVRHYNLLYWDSTQLLRTMDADEIFESFEGSFRATAAIIGREGVLVTGGAVAWQGKAILLPGTPEVGTSQLVEALVRAGATFLGDDYAALDDAGRVHRFSPNLAARARYLRDLDVPAPADAAAEGMPVATVIFARRVEGRPWRPRPITAGRAMMEFFSSVAAAPLQPAHTLPILQRTTSGARILKGTYGDPAEVARRLLQAVARAG